MIRVGRAAYLLRIDGEGEKLWDIRCREPTFVDPDRGLIESGDGGFVVTAGGAESDFLVVSRYDAAGSEAWSTTIRLPGMYNPVVRHLYRCGEGLVTLAPEKALGILGYVIF